MTPPGDPEARLRRAVMSLLHKAEAAAEAEALDAAAFVVVIHDPETRYSTFTGPFEDPLAALRHAETVEPQLNKGLGDGEPPFVVTVAPLHRPDPS